MRIVRACSAVSILIVFAVLIYVLGTTSNRVSNWLFDPSPTPSICAHQRVVVNGDDYSYFAVTEKACRP